MASYWHLLCLHSKWRSCLHDYPNITTCTRPEINFNLGFIFLFLKVHSWINLSILLRKSNHQIVEKKEQSFEFSSKL